MKSIEKLMLIDGNSILNRAFYGLQGTYMLRTKEGLYTNAIYGFLNIINKYIAEDKPEYIAVAFDLKAPTFRHKQYTQYKAQRKGMPEELACQLEPMKNVLDAMNIKRYELEGYEADDIIGTIAKKAEAEGLHTIIVTGDKDSFQLVDENITVKTPVTKAGKTETNIYTPKEVVERYGSDPQFIIDIKGLMGDPSDNIPGVPGVGEKTAIELIKEYKTIENIYEHIDEITKKALKEKLTENKELALLSKELATICIQVPGDWNFNEMKNTDPDAGKLYEIFSRLEFKSLIKKYNLQQAHIERNGVGDILTQDGVTAAAANTFQSDDSSMAGDASPRERPVTPNRSPQTIPTCPCVEVKDSAIFQKEIKGLEDYISSNPGTTIFLELERNKDGNPINLALFILGYKCIMIEILEEGTFGTQTSGEEIAQGLKQILPKIKISGHGLKQFLVYQKYAGNENINVYFDTALAMYVIDPAKNKYGVAELAEEYLGIEAENVKDIFDRVRILSILKEHMENTLRQNGQLNLYYNIEIPLMQVLADMEYRGFRLNSDELLKIGIKLDKRIIELTDEIHILAGDSSLNINSPKQLGPILFEKLALKPVKKTKTGYATGAEVLEELEGQHPIISLILEYRHLTKLKSTYIEGLIEVRNPSTGKIHSNLNQTVTLTGRLSSTEPNLQNIPVRMEIGKEIRKAFIPSDNDHVLLDADYSQIELRILAHITGDDKMRYAFTKEEDIHTRTASQVFGIPYEEVPYVMRSRAKAVNFGIVYGIGDYSLAKDLGITRKEAREYIDGYLENFSKVKDYMKNIIADGKENGYVTTMFDRRRYIPELSASNFQIRSFGERVALNTPIQGAAADIIKIAMIKVYDELLKQGLKSKLILQVHDELIIDTLKSEADQVAEILKNSMESAAELSVPLKAEVTLGRTWYECK